MLPYQLHGRGHPLLLIHGWGVTYTIWRKLLPLLSPHFQVIVVELPGMGAASSVVSDKPYYIACAEMLEEIRVTLHIDKWTILAYSTGTRAGEAYMQRYPCHVARAVFLCPLYLRRSWAIALQLDEWLDRVSPGAAGWFLSGWRLYLLILTLAFSFNLRHRAYVDEWMREISLQSLDHLKRVLFELPGKGCAPFMLPDTPSIPTLFIWGRQDALTAPPCHARPQDIYVFANHGAPLLIPYSITVTLLPFLKEEIYDKIM